MTEIMTNQAAWQDAPGQLLRIGVADLPKPAVLICNAAIAINPLDWILQDIALLPWLDYPAILGSDVASKVALALEPPSHSPTARVEVVLVWGGSSSVGCNAIQLAVASGYRCVATASAHNAGLLKELGASEVLDHSSPTIVDDVIEALHGRRLAGTLHATGGMADCFAAVARCEGSRRVAATLAPPDERPAGVEATHIFGTMLKDDEVGPMIYRDFLPQALATRTFVTAPPAKVLGHGLETLQAALQTLKAGISAAKVVVTLSCSSRSSVAFAV